MVIAMQRNTFFVHFGFGIMWYLSFVSDQQSQQLPVCGERNEETTEFAKHTALTSASDDSYNMVSLDFSLFFKSVTSFFRKQMDLRYTQPNHQHKCWFCTFLQTMNMLKLYSFLGSVFNFMLHFICAYALVTFRHKSHLVRVGKGHILDYNTCFGSHKPDFKCRHSCTYFCSAQRWDYLSQHALVNTEDLVSLTNCQQLDLTSAGPAVPIHS